MREASSCTTAQCSHCLPGFIVEILQVILVSLVFYWKVGNSSNGCLGEGRWPNGRADVSEPRQPGFDSSSRQPLVINIEHAELLRSTPSLVLCCAWLVTMALHVHCGLGQLSPLPTSEDDK